MPRVEPVRLLLAVPLILALPRPVAAQRELGIQYGRWIGGMSIYEARIDRPLGAWLRHGMTLQVLAERGGAGRGFYGAGYEVQALRGRTTFGPYVALGGALGVAVDSAGQSLAALWSVGAGFEWRPVRVLALDVEERYRVTDHGPHGFWAPGSPRHGFGTTVGIAISLGSPGRRHREPAGASVGSGYRPAADPPTPPLMTVAGRAGDVVQTALDVLGSPYQWGGTAENGFDCSGLIQYAYARIGIRLPRTSRDQARAGHSVAAVVDSLEPGDILAFAARRGGPVTHVGMYVGEGKFIHSSSAGVRLSRLEAADPDGAYWIPKWVGARRILP
jgi:NlpC/P60 family